jgi:BASS family bile acid:Na+ symporter
VKELVALGVQISLLLIVVSIGLQARWSDLTYAFRHPRQLLKAFVAVNLVVPLVAYVLCRLLPMEPMTEVGLVLMAVSPLAPFAPGKMLKAGADRPFVDGLYLTLLIAAVIIVPATIALLSSISLYTAQVSIVEIGSFVAKSVLVPMLVGLTISGIWPTLAAKLAPIARIAGYALLLPIALLILWKMGSGLAGLIGHGGLIVITLTVLAGIAAGHWLGGDVPGHRVALSQAAATRHPGIAGLIAHKNFADPQVILAIVLFLLVSIVISALYSRWAHGRFAVAGDDLGSIGATASARDSPRE